MNGSLSLPTEVVTSTTTTTYNCTRYRVFILNGVKRIGYKGCCGDDLTSSTANNSNTVDTEVCLLNGSNISILWSNPNSPSISIPIQEGTYTFPNTNVTYTLTNLGGCACIDSSGNETNVTTTTTISDVVQSLAPTFELDHIGLKESYFIYWFKDFDILKLNKLYMRVKFFNGKTGEYTTFTTRKQTSINANSPFRINNDYFYREVTFDFVNYLYDVIGFGKSLLTLDWYEYINPPKNNG